MTAAQARLFSGLTSMSLTRRGAGWNNRIIICYGSDDPRYPLRLKSIADYPGALLVSGGLAPASQRAACRYWQSLALLVWRPLGKLFSETLAHKGITITSGLALGIDGVAHARRALAAEVKLSRYWAMGRVRFIRGAMQLSPGRSSTMAVRWYLNFHSLRRRFPHISPGATGLSAA